MFPSMDFTYQAHNGFMREQFQTAAAYTVLAVYMSFEGLCLASKPRLGLSNACLSVTSLLRITGAAVMLSGAAHVCGL